MRRLFITVLSIILLVCSKLITGQDENDNGVLKCNLCLGRLDSDCANNIDSVVQHCIIPKSVKENIKNVFFENSTSTENINYKKELDAYCVKFATQDTKYTGAFVDRSCGYVPSGIDFCKYLKEKLPGVIKCSACQKDMCN